MNQKHIKLLNYNFYVPENEKKEEILEGKRKVISSKKNASSYVRYKERKKNLRNGAGTKPRPDADKGQYCTIQHTSHNSI